MRLISKPLETSSAIVRHTQDFLQGFWPCRLAHLITRDDGATALLNLFQNPGKRVLVRVRRSLAKIARGPQRRHFLRNRGEKQLIQGGMLLLGKGLRRFKERIGQP